MDLNYNITLPENDDLGVSDRIAEIISGMIGEAHGSEYHIIQPEEGPITIFFEDVNVCNIIARVLQEAGVDVTTYRIGDNSAPNYHPT